MGVPSAALISTRARMQVIVCASHHTGAPYGRCCALLGAAGAVAKAGNRVSSEMPPQIAFALAIESGADVDSGHGFPGVPVAASIAIVRPCGAQAQIALSTTGDSGQALLKRIGLVYFSDFVVFAALSPMRLLIERAGYSHRTISLLLSTTSVATASPELMLMFEVIRPHHSVRQLSNPNRHLPIAMRTPLLQMLPCAE